MANTAKKASSAKRASNKKAPANKVAASKNSEEMQGKNPKTNAQNEPQGAVKTRFESTKELISNGLTSFKNGVASAFNTSVDFIKGLFSKIVAFCKGLFSKEQWAEKADSGKNIFNVVALLSIAVLGAQYAVATVGLSTLAIGASVATVACFGISRIAMDSDKRKSLGVPSLREVALPSMCR
jgi:hypothetical protein